MKFRFTIIDRSGTETIIDDPKGWDTMTLKLLRDNDKHGILFSHALESLTYYGTGADILTDEYDNYGIEGKCELLIEYLCEDDTYLMAYWGRYDFNTYERNMGDECSVSIGLEDDNDEQILANLFETKVNIETATSLNGTSLTPYDKLGFPLSMVSKAIFVSDSSKQIADTVDLSWQEAMYDPSFVAPDIPVDGVPAAAIFVPAFDTTISSEIGGYVTPMTDAPTSSDEWMWATLGKWSSVGGVMAVSTADPVIDGAVMLPYPPYIGLPNPVPLPYTSIGRHYQYFYPDNVTPVLDYDASLGNSFGVLTNYTLHFKFKVDLNFISYPGTEMQGFQSSCWYCGIRDANNKWRWLADPADWADFRSTTSSMSTVMTVNADRDITLTGITLNPGDRIYIFNLLWYIKRPTGYTSPTMTVKYYEGNTFQFSGLSKSASIAPKSFLINEVMSRVSEAITNDSIRVYSEYFGRPDSQPYAFTDYGCGSLLAITKGLFLRQMEKRQTTTPPLLSMSWQDIWNGINPIHNIGLGFEDDPYRPGYRCMRVESWRHFYDDSVGFSCIGVRSVRKSVRYGDYVTTFRIGYQKWESQSFSGIDEFLTKREYRTDITNTKGTFEKLSSFIASGYAIEVTKRKGNLSTDDYTYDNDIFVIACYYVSGFDIYTAETGTLAASTTDNIIDPGSIYNWSIRPSQNMMRWAPTVFTSYKDYDSGSSITFTNGEGNFYAEGKDEAVLCSPSSAVRSEKGTITPALFTDSTFPEPIYLHEDVVYDFPLTVEEFYQIKDASYKLIYWEIDADNFGYGWLRSLEYDIDKQMATFTLKPKR